VWLPLLRLFLYWMNLGHLEDDVMGSLGRLLFTRYSWDVWRMTSWALVRLSLY
jgi:hypothetical protein